ncbi:hypothetical protein vseg_008744 [Gypsophila vaccaria]
MAENSKKIEEVEMKMEAMKKVYAEVIMNTSKEAAFRIQEAEARSLNQQKKIDELEAQLGEAEGIIVDLRDERKRLHDKLETMTKEMNMLSNGNTAERKEPVHECLLQNDALGSSIAALVSDAKAASVGVASPDPTSLNYKSSVVTDGCSVPGKSNLNAIFAGNEDICSYIMQNTEADLCKNGYSQRIRAFKSKSSTVKLPTLEAGDPQSLANVLVETSEDKSRETSLAQSVVIPYPNCPSKPDQIIGAPRRSAGKNARYREAIVSLRGKPRKRYVRSWKPPLRGQLKACSSCPNVNSVGNPAVAVKTLLESNLCCGTVPDNLSPSSDVKNRRYDVLPDGELDHVVCGERADEEASEGLKKKMRLTVVDGLVGSELFDVPISEGFGSLHKQVQNVRPLEFTFHRKGRKNILRKLDENIVHVKCPVERKMEKLTDVCVVASDVLNKDMNGELEMVDR